MSAKRAHDSANASELSVDMSYEVIAKRIKCNILEYISDLIDADPELPQGEDTVDSAVQKQIDELNCAREAANKWIKAEYTALGRAVGSTDAGYPHCGTPIPPELIWRDDVRGWAVEELESRLRLLGIKISAEYKKELGCYHYGYGFEDLAEQLE